MRIYNLISIAAVFLFSLSSFANEGYWNPEKLPRVFRPKNYEKVLDAVVGFNDATGILISNQGHVLIALHELLAADEDKTGFEPIFLEDSFVTFRATQNFSSELVLQNVKITNRKLGEFTSSAKVLFVGRFSSPQLDVLRASFAKDTKLPSEASVEDFAIVQIDRADTPCLETAQEAKPGEQIWQIGRPLPSHLSNFLNGVDGNRDTSGLTKLWLSFGKIVSQEPAQDSPPLITVAPELIFRTDAEGYHGFSGGPVVNKNSELIGIVTGPAGQWRKTSSKHPQAPEDGTTEEFHFEKWQGATAVKMEQIRQRLLKAGQAWPHCSMPASH